MLKYVAMAAAAALSALGAAKAVVTLDVREPNDALLVQAEAAAASGQPASIARAPDGHYWAQADVNGAQVRFLVDTGATAVALTPNDALRLGLNPAGLEYGYKVTTASGEARAARVKLASVAVSGARVNDVDAFVIEQGLETSLLGMTFLGRLSGFEATQSALILRP